MTLVQASDPAAKWPELTDLLYVGATYDGLVHQQRAQMRDPAYFVLASLLAGPLHGYAIIQRAEHLSGGRVRLATGTLYTALDRLTAGGYVELVSEEIVNGRARRSYGLTPPSAGALRAEAERMAAAASLVTERGQSPKTVRRARKVSALERRCRWLLHAYPAWYRRHRGGEMLGTLLEASPPGANWPSVRDARALVIGGLRVRGWTWLISMLWVVIGAAGAIYATVTFSHAGYGQGAIWMVQWPGEPQVIIDVAVIALPVWVLLSVPVLVAGFVRVRAWRPRYRLRVAGWAGSWVAGLVLMNQTADWAAAGQGGTRGVLSLGELAICAAWLALGGAMTWILSGPQTWAESSVSDGNVATG
jgi:PadR family transcriptional regulator, regulatory protein PadR